MHVYHIYMYLEIRDPYSFFIRVVSRASKFDGILAQLQFRLPEQMSRIIERMVIKLCVTGTFDLICTISISY